jgi:hypothetical protein
LHSLEFFYRHRFQNFEKTNRSLFLKKNLQTEQTVTSCVVLSAGWIAGSSIAGPAGCRLPAGGSAGRPARQLPAPIRQGKAAGNPFFQNWNDKKIIKNTKCHRFWWFFALVHF